MTKEKVFDKVVAFSYLPLSKFIFREYLSIISVISETTFSQTLTANNDRDMKINKLDDFKFKTWFMAIFANMLNRNVVLQHAFQCCHYNAMLTCSSFERKSKLFMQRNAKKSIKVWTNSHQVSNQTCFQDTCKTIFEISLLACRPLKWKLI